MICTFTGLIVTVIAGGEFPAANAAAGSGPHAGAAAVVFTQAGGPGGNRQKPTVKLVREPQLLKLLMQPPLQKELALSDEQRKQIAGIADEYRRLAEDPLRGADPGRLPPRERNALQGKLRETESKLLQTLDRALSETQWRRLWQIELQMRGLDILNDETVARKLYLSDAQRKAIALARVSGRDELDKLRKDLRRQFKGRDQKRRLAVARLQAYARVESRITELLTTRQRETLRQLTGKPFDVWLLKGVKGRPLFQGPRPKPKKRPDV